MRRSAAGVRHFGDFYNARKAASELRSYRNKGPIPSTRMLIDALKAEGVEGATVIDIGGGIGAVQHELLAAGAATATSVDASDAYIQAAREESARRDLAGRVTYYHGDFLELAEMISRRYRDARPRHQRLSRLDAVDPFVSGTGSPPVRPRLSTQYSARQDGGECDEPARVARTRPGLCAPTGRDREADQSGRPRSVVLEDDRTLAGCGLSPPLIINVAVVTRTVS